MTSYTYTYHAAGRPKTKGGRRVLYVTEDEYYEMTTGKTRLERIREENERVERENLRQREKRAQEAKEREAREAREKAQEARAKRIDSISAGTKVEATQCLNFKVVHDANGAPISHVNGAQRLWYRAFTVKRREEGTVLEVKREVEGTKASARFRVRFASTIKGYEHDTEKLNNGIKIASELASDSPDTDLRKRCSIVVREGWLSAKDVELPGEHQPWWGQETEQKISTIQVGTKVVATKGLQVAARFGKLPFNVKQGTEGTVLGIREEKYNIPTYRIQFDKTEPSSFTQFRSKAKMREGWFLLGDIDVLLAAPGEAALDVNVRSSLPPCEADKSDRQNFTPSESALVHALESMKEA